jgi:hypothetical protein
VHLDDRRVELAAERGDPRVTVGSGGDDHMVGLDPAVAEGDDVPIPFPGDPLHVDPVRTGRSNLPA